MGLIWTRQRDGQHNGKPVYEYYATCEDREFHIVWASDRGGTFGYTAKRGIGNDRTYITERYGIHWCGTLKACKHICEEINTKEMENHERS